jgi:hypothetical protein
VQPTLTPAEAEEKSSLRFHDREPHDALLFIMALDSPYQYQNKHNDDNQTTATARVNNNFRSQCGHAGFSFLSEAIGVESLVLSGLRRMSA